MPSRRPLPARLLCLLALLAALVAPAPAAAAGPDGTRAALARWMAHAGSGSGAYAIDLDTGETLYASRENARRVPASVQKLYTTAAALLRFGPDARLTTSASALGEPDPVTGVLAGDLHLVGGGDPTFGAAEAAALADRVAAAGVRRIEGGVVGDESAFDALRGPPSSGYRASIWVGGPLSALAYQRGRTGLRSPAFQATPALFAAQAFRRALRRAGVRVRRAATLGVTPAGALAVAEQRSPTLAELAARTNAPSDNYVAETLLKALGATFGLHGSTAAGAGVVRSTLAPLGIAPLVVDGSGLSRANRTTPRQVVGLLAHMATAETAGPGVAFTASLAVAGRTGTLSTRMRGTAAQDRCRGKTGSLSGISALAGYCVTRTGRRVAFAFLMNRLSVPGARALQDRMTSVLARYG